MNLPQIWLSVLGDLQMQTARQEFEAWLKQTVLLSIEDGLATIGTQTLQSKNAIESRYLGHIRRTMAEVLGFSVTVRVVIGQHQVQAQIQNEPLPLLWEQAAGEEHTPRPTTRTLPKASITQPTAGPLFGGGASSNPGNGANGQHAHSGYAPGQYANGSFGSTQYSASRSNGGDGAVQLDLSSAMRGMLNARYDFARFIVGSSNRLAHAACMAVAEHPAQAYNPLFLYGGVGLGKTHLLHAIGNYALDRDPEINVLYVSSEKFTNDLINAIRRQQTDEFRIRYRNIDILLIDDIQFIAGKESTQEEFFHTFNTLHSAAKQIVISSDRPPKAILTLEERLRSRFEWGLIVDIQPPDLETRTAILRAKGEQMQAHIPGEVIDFLAHKIQSNIRELEGCLNRVVAFANLHGLAVTVDVAAQALSELIDNSRRRRITPEIILNTVAHYYQTDLKAMQGRGRNRQVVVPRQVAMYLLREETDCSLMEIGNFLGGRDHTTVMYGCDKINEEINADARLRQDVATIRERLYAQSSA